jgi:hypothetical protein|nr:MAG TPA: hypothetical protein [Caudoviricetes sp.]
METPKLRTLEMLRFENWLWQHYNPAEVFEDWADKTTEAVMALSIAADLDPTEIALPLSDAIIKPLRELHNLFRTPLEERDPSECIFGFYPGEALTEDELRWVAVHIQSALIPAL